ncbi:MAG: CHAT domain-containing protein [Prevotella sp.]|nr:CHAT domain-containing protein [Prevotella sp.]
MVRIFIFLTFILFSVHSACAQTDAQLQEWMQKGQTAAEQGNYQEAIPYFELLREAMGKRFGEGNEAYGLTCHTLSTFYSHVGDYAKAVEVETKALESYKVVFGENHSNYASILSNIAGYYSDLGDYTKALETGTRAMEICKAANGENHPNYATAMANLAGYYYDLGDYNKAVEMGMKAMEIRKATLGDNNIYYAMSLNNVASYYSELGDYVTAVEMGTKAVEIYKALLGESHPDYATTLSNLAGYYDRLGDYDKAVEMGTQAVVIYRAALGDNHPLLATAWNNAAAYCTHLGDHETAVRAGTKALEIRKATLGENHPDYATTLSNLAGYYAELGDYNKAMEMGTKAVELRKTVLGENHPDYATALSNLASYYYDLGNYAKAMQLEEQALAIRKVTLGENHPDYAQSLATLAYCHSEQGNYAKGLEYYRENIALLQSNTLQQFASLTSAQRTMFWEKDSYQFTDAYPLMVYQSHATTAPDLYDKSALFAKGLLLSTEMELNRLIQESGDAEAMKMFEELALNRLQLQKLYETPIAERHVNTDSLEQTIFLQEQALVKRSKEYGDFTRRLRTTWKDVQQALKKDEIAIEFLSFHVEDTDSTMVVALTLRKKDKAPKFIPLFEQHQLQTVSDRLYYNCPEVTSLVWEPLQQELKGVKKIYFSPAGALHSVGIEYAPGMEGYEMYRLSTTREILTQPNPSQGGERVEASLFGGVDYNASTGGTPPLDGTGEVSNTGTSHRALVDSLSLRGLSASYLPFTLSEVQAIKTTFENKSRRYTITTGGEATEASIKALSAHAPRILHIATHGFYFTENQAKSKKKLRFLGQDIRQGLANLEDKALTRSGLLLAGANATMKGKAVPLGEEDGILTAQEISHLDLRGLDLVVLSACKTGTGDVNQGEGVFGLQRGFKKAGAQTLVMSLWEVNDEATQILMTDFYNNLMQGQPKRDAFHNAQLTLREHTDNEGNHIFDEPQFWAAFILLD